MQLVLQFGQRLGSAAIKEDFFSGLGRLLAIAPHQVRSIDAFLAAETEPAQHPGDRRPIRGRHVRFIDHLPEFRIPVGRHHGMGVADADVPAFMPPGPFIDPRQGRVPIQDVDSSCQYPACDPFSLHWLSPLP